MGSNPGTIYWMDIFSHIFVVKICNVCLKRPKINKKEAEVGPFLKKKLFMKAEPDPNAIHKNLSPLIYAMLVL